MVWYALINDGLEVWKINFPFEMVRGFSSIFRGLALNLPTLLSLTSIWHENCGVDELNISIPLKGAYTLHV